MIKLALLCCGLLILAGCRRQEKPAIAEESAASVLDSRIKKEKEVYFRAWNGDYNEAGHTCHLWLEQSSIIGVQTEGLGFQTYSGSFTITQQGVIEAKMKEGRDEVEWPRMVLRRDGENLLLYREDGKTSWHDKEWPYRAQDCEGFWPLRASKNKKAE